MLFSELYEKDLNRKVNPAVSASDLSASTIDTEIDEYVFTPEIITNLYYVLSNIRKNQGTHVGIWINGYYGSGKSHFLKYANYCMHKSYAERAFSRLIEAAQRHLNDEALALLQTNVNIGMLQSLRQWYAERAQVEVRMFNIGDVHNANDSSSIALTTILWHQFNALRGFNTFSLALAQHLEKALYVDGKYDEFKALVRSRGYDWQRNLSVLASSKLDLTLDMAHEVDPSLSIDVIRENIKRNNVNVSVDAFAQEVKEYIVSKGNKDYRLLFLIDEMSQFIGEHRESLLQLQSLVERLHTVCQSQVWIACTAQQTLDEVVTAVGGHATLHDDIGKILGRFEVRASLQGTKPEYITQQRILEKRGERDIDLKKRYAIDHEKLAAQFILPATYEAYTNDDTFAKYYPFVPYQFQLIMKVLDNFVNIGFVDRQVKGNERSLLNITHSIAKATASWELGRLIPFDMFFGPMFQSSMQHRGLRAIENAHRAVAQTPPGEDREFYRRVEYVLFMISHLSDADKPGFAATIDNIVTLLMDEIDADKAATKEHVQRVLNYLIDKSVIRRDKSENGADIYVFYTEAESQVAEMIKNQHVDSTTYAEELNNILVSYYAPSNKESYATRSFSIGYSVDDRHYLTNNGDVEVDFVISSIVQSAEEYALNNKSSHLVFFLAQQWKDDRALRETFLRYCQVQCYMHLPANSDDIKKVNERFRERAKDQYRSEICPAVRQLLDTCPLVSGQSVMSEIELKGGDKGADKSRYKRAIACHIGNVYPFAKVVDNVEVPKNANELRVKITRRTEQIEFQQPLSVAEAKVQDYLSAQVRPVTADDVVRYFDNPPYGWSELATLYTLTELVRRQLYTLSYNNRPNANRETIAQHIAKERSSFTIAAAQAIAQSVLNDFVAAWNHIFNSRRLVGTNDAQELYQQCVEAPDSALNELLVTLRDLSATLAQCPFVGPLREAVTLLEQWKTVRDPRRFFETVTLARSSASTLVDTCKKISDFYRQHYDRYDGILSFLTANHDNFSYLSDRQEAITSLESIRQDATPWNNLPAYLKIKKDLESQLRQRRQQLVDNITGAYNSVFDELERYADSVHVDRSVFADRSATLQQRCASHSFSTLTMNANVSAFREAQMKKISDAIAVSSDATADTIVRPRQAITLHTYTSTPIRCEADVDSYLQRLKQEIMTHLRSDCDIIIN